MENLRIISIMEIDRVVCEPTDSVGFSRTGGVLDKIILTSAMRFGVGHDLANSVKLLEARENKNLTLPVGFKRHELTDDVDQNGAREDRGSPVTIAIEISDAVLVLDVRVSCAAFTPTVEW